MAVFPSSINLYISTGTVTSWVDVSNRVVSPFTAEMGMTDESYETRLADPGYFTFNLDNRSEQFTPSENFGKGTKVKLEVTYDSLTRVKFFGQIDEAEIDVGTSGERFVRVSCFDWLDYSLGQPVRDRAVETSKRMDDGIRGLMTDMPVQPDSTQIDLGNTVFPTIYDQVDRQTSIYREFNNLIISEYGYGYMDKGGQRFRVENKNARGGIPEVSYVPSNESGYLQLASGTNNYLQLIGGGRVLLNNTQDAVFSGTFSAIDDNPKIVHGKHILNEVEFVVYPKEVDTTDVVLFQLDEPIFIPELAEKRFTAFFSDPDSGQQIGGTSLVPLVTGTHYSAFQYETASGTVYTSNLSFEVTSKVNSVEYLVTNNGAGAWLTTLIQKGRGIYPRNPLNTIAENAASQAQHGVRSLSIRQPYQQTIDLGEEESEKIIDIERKPRNVVVAARFKANSSDFNMQCFMHLDIGSLIQIINAKPAINSYYHINGMKWTIERGGDIEVVWILKEMPTFTPIAVEFNGRESNTENGVDYGVPAQLANLNQSTYSIWVNPKNPVVSTSILMGKYTSTAQKVLAMFDGGVLRFIQLFTGVDGSWRTTNPVLTGTSDRWIHIGLTYDASNVANDPVIYVTGSAVALTEETTPTGNPENDKNARFIVGNGAFTASVDWSYNPDWVFKDARVYNRVLSAAEIITIVASPNDQNTVPNGLVWQAPYVRNFRYNEYVNQVITTDMKIFDRVSGLAGVPHYNVTTGTYSIYGRDPTASSY